jgi:amidase
MGPLHGLPVSLKDQFHVKNVETSMGYVGWIGGNMRVDESKALKVESELTFEMLSLGAVLYCKVYGQISRATLDDRLTVTRK